MITDLVHRKLLTTRRQCLIHVWGTTERRHSCFIPKGQIKISVLPLGKFYQTVMISLVCGRGNRPIIVHLGFASGTGRGGYVAPMISNNDERAAYSFRGRI